MRIKHVPCRRDRRAPQQGRWPEDAGIHSNAAAWFRRDTEQLEDRLTGARHAVEIEPPNGARQRLELARGSTEHPCGTAPRDEALRLNDPGAPDMVQNRSDWLQAWGRTFRNFLHGEMSPMPQQIMLSLLQLYRKEKLKEHEVPATSTEEPSQKSE